MSRRTSFATGSSLRIKSGGELTGRSPLSTQLLDFVQDEKADLIVAGGYGHSRLGEWIFGGVTQESAGVKSGVLHVVPLSRGRSMRGTEMAIECCERLSTIQRRWRCMCPTQAGH